MASIIDELAATGRYRPDATAPVAHQPRALAQALVAVAEMSDCERPLETAADAGVAFQVPFGVPTAEVEVTLTKDGIRIDQVFVATDVGIALDPRNIEAQLESAVIFGLSAAERGEITLDKGGGTAQLPPI